MDQNFAFNSQLSQVNSGAALSILKVHCLPSEYDALIDSGSSHNFVSQLTFDQLRSLQKSSGEIGMEPQQQDRLQVVLADGTSIFSRSRMKIKVTMENGISMQV